MTIQTIELLGERYVILSEREFLALQAKHPSVLGNGAAPSDPSEQRFREVAPLPVGGMPASQILIQDRR